MTTYPRRLILSLILSWFKFHTVLNVWFNFPFIVTDLKIFMLGKWKVFHHRIIAAQYYRWLFVKNIYMFLWVILFVDFFVDVLVSFLKYPHYKISFFQKVSHLKFWHVYKSYTAIHIHTYLHWQKIICQPTFPQDTSNPDPLAKAQLDLLSKLIGASTTTNEFRLNLFQNDEEEE